MECEGWIAVHPGVATESNNLVLEHLRATRASVGKIERDLGDVRHRVSSIERHLGCEHD